MDRNISTLGLGGNRSQDVDDTLTPSGFSMTWLGQQYDLRPYLVQ
jgi:hypothetical protein